MKRLFLAAFAALLATSANATILMYSANEAGGTIQFSDMPCSKLNGLPYLQKLDGLATMVIDAGGNAVGFGCWTYLEPNLAVTWQNGTSRLYPAANVTITTVGRKLFEQAKSASY